MVESGRFGRVVCDYGMLKWWWWWWYTFGVFYAFFLRGFFVIWLSLFCLWLGWRLVMIVIDTNA